jgi:hypothetical protein
MLKLVVFVFWKNCWADCGGQMLLFLMGGSGDLAIEDAVWRRFRSSSCRANRSFRISGVEQGRSASNCQGISFRSTVGES